MSSPTTSGQSFNDPGSSNPGISGKKLTYITLGMLTLVIGSLIYLLAIYDQLDAARAKTIERWRSVSSELNQDYRKVESMSVEQLGAPADWLQQFKSDADQFRTATNIETQVAYAVKLEDRLKKSASILGASLPPSTDLLRQEVASFNDCVGEEATILGSRAGRFLHVIIPVPVRQPLELGR